MLNVVINMILEGFVKFNCWIKFKVMYENVFLKNENFKRLIVNWIKF